MITYAKIQAKTGNRITFEKGLAYYREGRVSSFSVNTQKTEHRVTASVRGSGRERYEVSLAYDTEYEEIADYDCTCQAFYNYNGMCKHCVAAALEYMDYILRQEAILKYANERRNEERRSGESRGHRTPMQPIREPQTTPLMKQMLERQAVRRTLPMLETERYGKIRLEPILRCDKDMASVEFRIGAGQMYVLKDIFTFVDAVNEKREYRYGQKLHFVHSMEMFDPRSAQLAAFLCRWGKENRSKYVQGYYGNSLPTLRRIPLAGSELEELLGMVREESVLCSIGDGEPVMCRIVEDEWRQELTIQGKEKGIEISLTPRIVYEGRQYRIYPSGNQIVLVPRTFLEPAADFLNCFEQSDLSRIYIQRADVPLFCREILPNLEQCFACEKKNFMPQKYGVEEVSFEIYLDKLQEDMIAGKIYALYGETKIDMLRDRETDGGRDVAKEWAVREAVTKYFNAYDEDAAMLVLSGDEEKECQLLTEGIPFFQSLGEVFVTDALKQLRVRPAPKVSVGVSLSGNLLELTLLADDMDMDQLAEILCRYDRKKKYYRLKNGEFVMASGAEMEALAALKDGLGLTERQLKSGLIELPKYRAMYLDEQLRRRETGDTFRNREFKALIRNMKTVEDSDFEVPESLKGVLREYQKRGFLWLKTLKWNGFGGILADDMGLGKTLQVIAFLLSEKAEKPSLVVCPASLVYNWESELQRFAPELKVRVVVGTAAERRRILDERENGDILVTSYDLLKRDVEWYQEISFAAEFIDEAQYIKNHLTQAAVSVKQVKADFKAALTGTPIENRLSELWSIFDYLMPGFLYSYPEFHRQIEIPVVQRQDQEAAERLKKMVQPFILRRLKTDVLKDLPDKLEEKVYAKLEGEQRSLYDAHVRKLQILLANAMDASDRMRLLAELTRLRQVCCDPALLYENYKGGSAKLDLCVDLVKNAVQGGHKILLFSQFTTMLDRIAERLTAEGIAFYQLYGSTGLEQRTERIAAFQKDDTPVFLISLKAGGTGLNLTAADIVIHYDPWWNQAVQNQATDRSHRIGQKNVVTVYQLIAKGTIEERVVELQERKRNLADRMLEGDLDGSRLTPEELREILQELPPETE